MSEHPIAGEPEFQRQHLVCLHEDRWIALTETLKRIETKADDLGIKQEAFNKRMFIGNGEQAYVQLIQRNTKILNVILNGVGAIVLLGLTAFLGTLFYHLWGTRG